MKSTQRLCGRPFLHSDDSILVLNVKDDARVGQKTALARGHRCLASDSIDNGLLQWFELLLGGTDWRIFGRQLKNKPLSKSRASKLGS